MSVITIEQPQQIDLVFVPPQTVQVQLAQAVVGAEGPVGPVGPPGEQGVQGIQGVPGPKGDAGATTDIAATTHAATTKATPADADELPLIDSAASWALKRLTFANLKAVLLAYFSGQFREKLTAARTYYVRTDGNDSNTGLSNTAGGAFRTIQKAINEAARFDLNNYDPLILVGAGSYGENLVLKAALGGGRITVRRNSAVPGAVLVGSITAQTVATPYAFDGLSLTAGSATWRILATDATIDLANLVIGAPTASHIAATGGAVVTASGPLELIGSASSALYASTIGRVEIRGQIVTLTGTPAFGVGFIHAYIGGVAMVDGCTFTGAATGPRYSASVNSSIFVNGAGLTYLPGNAVGTTATGGQYV